MSKLKGENSIISKQHNRGRVFKLIVTGQCKSRIEISRLTGLSKMTVAILSLNYLCSYILAEVRSQRHWESIWQQFFRG